MRRSKWLLTLMTSLYPFIAHAKDATPRSAITACEACHGSSAAPRINAQWPHYILGRLVQLGETEPDENHAPHAWLLAINVPARWRSKIVEYFANLPPTASDGSDPSGLGAEIYRRGIPDRKVAACAYCHGPHGEGSGPIPRLAGQHKSYLEMRLDILSGFTLPGSGAMHLAVESVTPAEIDAVTAYLATK
jgi:cytochrome c553